MLQANLSLLVIKLRIIREALRSTQYSDAQMMENISALRTQLAEAEKKFKIRQWLRSKGLNDE